jgi:hypothetical protein
VLTGRTAAYTIAATVLAAVKAQLVNVGAELPRRVCVVPGGIAWDECECNGGQLAVTLTRSYMADSFPLQAIKPQWNNAAGYIIMEFVVQIIRCAPNMDDQGNPPSCDSLDKSAQAVLVDAYEVMCVTASTLAAMTTVDIDDYVLYDQVFVGPEGACVGSELKFAVQVLR